MNIRSKEVAPGVFRAEYLSTTWLLRRPIWRIVKTINWVDVIPASYASHIDACNAAQRELCIERHQVKIRYCKKEQI